MPLVKSVATLYQVYLYILLDALIIAEITIRLTNRKDYLLYAPIFILGHRK